MIDKGQWREFGQDTGITPLLFTRSAMGFLMTKGPRFNVSPGRITLCIVQIHYPFVMFGMKTSTKLTAVKIDLINIFLPFFLHKSVNQPQS